MPDAEYGIERVDKDMTLIPDQGGDNDRPAELERGREFPPRLAESDRPAVLATSLVFAVVTAIVCKSERGSVPRRLVGLRQRLTGSSA